MSPMSFNEVIAELRRLTFEERHILIRRALESDDPLLSAADEELVEARLAEHHSDPGSSIPLEEMTHPSAISIKVLKWEVVARAQARRM